MADLDKSDRFQKPIKRRDFLGLAGTASCFSAFLAALVGSLKLPIPSVFPESSSRFSPGRPEDFPEDSATRLAEHHVWMIRDDEGLYAISSICTHLGCITSRQKDGRFLCPCHGSRFDAKGNVVGGPAPRALARLEISLAPNGQLLVDKEREVDQDTRFLV